MKQNYLSAKRLSIWMRLSKKWNKLYNKVQETTNLKSLKKLNNLSLLLGVKRKIALTALAGVVTLGVQAQGPFEHVFYGDGQIILNLGIDNYSVPVFEDIDGDGDQDLVVGEYDGTLKYYTNNNKVFTEQTGTESPFTGIDVGNNSSPVFEDIDGDGDQDLVIGERLGTIKYYTNANNVFTEQTGTDNPFRGINVINSSAPVFADLDGDGDQDLVVGERQGILRYYTNANNVFTEQTDTDNPFNGIDVGYYSFPVFEDIDGDGDQDLIVGNNDGKLNYYTNSNKVFTEQTGADSPFTGIDVGNNSSPVFEDIDGDGDLDLVIGKYYGTIKYYTNANNVFTEQTGTDNPFNSIDVGYISSPVFADIDGDGDQDLAIGEFSSTLKYYTNSNKILTEQTGTDNPFGSTDVVRSPSPAFADIDGDGDQDLLIGELQGTLNYYTNSNNVFAEETGMDNPFNGIDVGNNCSPAFADIDGDGDQDLVIGNNDGTLKYYTNTNKVFTEQTGTDNIFNGIDVGSFSSPVFADIDGDGDQDLVIGEYHGTLKYYTNINKVFTEQTGADNPFNGIVLGPFLSPVFADIDGDGDQDLFVGTQSGMIVEYRNDQIINGLFTTVSKESLNIYPNPASSIIYTEEGQLNIVDALGNQVLSTESEGKVDVSNLESGVYIVIQNGKRTKLIIE